MLHIDESRHIDLEVWWEAAMTRMSVTWWGGGKRDFTIIPLMSRSLSPCHTHSFSPCQTVVLAATHCSTLQHTAAHHETVQQTAAHCKTLQHAAMPCDMLQHAAIYCDTLRFHNHSSHVTLALCMSYTRTVSHDSFLPMSQTNE